MMYDLPTHLLRKPMSLHTPLRDPKDRHKTASTSRKALRHPVPDGVLFQDDE